MNPIINKRINENKKKIDNPNIPFVKKSYEKIIFSFMKIINQIIGNEENKIELIKNVRM